MGKKKIKPVLCDSNILFEYLRGDEKIKANLEAIGKENLAFPIITHAEAYAGSSKIQFALLKIVLPKYIVCHLTEEASKIFNGLIQSYHTRHSKWIPDALIASIALSNNMPLYTLNRKDFDFIPGLKLYNPK